MLPVIIGGLVVVATVTYIGLSWVENKDFPIKKNKPSSSPKENKAHSASSLDITQEIQPLALGLVLKGNKLENIHPNTTLPLENLEKALLEADYFFCTSQRNMKEVRGRMSLDNALDTNSEQQVLVIICFESELEEGKTFSNKLELTQFLRKGESQQFKVDSVATLLKVSGLAKAGFIRS